MDEIVQNAIAELKLSPDKLPPFVKTDSQLIELWKKLASGSNDLLQVLASFDTEARKIMSDPYLPKQAPNPVAIFGLVGKLQAKRALGSVKDYLRKARVYDDFLMTGRFTQPGNPFQVWLQFEPRRKGFIDPAIDKLANRLYIGQKPRPLTSNWRDKKNLTLKGTVIRKQPFRATDWYKLVDTKAVWFGVRVTAQGLIFLIRFGLYAPSAKLDRNVNSLVRTTQL